MVLFKYDKEPLPGCETVYMFPGQVPLQKALLLISLLSVPVLLLGKPMIIKKKMDRAKNHLALHNQNGTHGEGDEVVDVTGEESAGEHGDEHHEFSDVMIHQAIHTIEYVLGSVSHTASYLRLWALSLAHSRKCFVLVLVL